MAQHKVIDLINQFMEDHGQSSGKDRVMLWLEDVYSKIRALPWSWNLKVTETQTGGDYIATPIITSVVATETFSWTQGNNYIESTASTVKAVSNQTTGRYVYIDNEWYQCVRIAPLGDTDKIYLDKKIVAATAATQTVSFYRRDLAFNTNGIKSVHVDERKLEHLTEEQIYRFKRGLDPRWYYGDSGDPLAYHIDEKQLSAPQYAPLVTETAGSTDTEIGTHVLFWTFKDIETGQEGPPGPSVEFTVTSSTGTLNVDYKAASTSHGDEVTYSRVLYVSKKRTLYTRNPMFNLASKTALQTTAVAWSLSDSDLEDNSQYYDGPWTKFVMYPAPVEYNRAEVLHIDSWSGLPGENHILKLGRQREFIELFHLYFLMKQSLQNKDPTQFRQMQGSFREQLNFMLSQDGDDRRLDPSSWEYKFFSPSSTVSQDEDFTASLKYPF